MISQAKVESAIVRRPAYRRGPHWMALFAVLFTIPLLFVGGSVTTYRVGLAVPDWPSTFGINMFLYDFWNAPFGVQVEHTHRLYGAAVGLATIGLCTWLLAVDPRRWVKGLGVLSLLAVIAQGVLGGIRVTRVSTFLAAVHGCTAQAFFGLMIVLCVLTSRGWLQGRPMAPDEAGLRPRTLALVVLIYLQIVVGAWLRHFGTLAALWGHAAAALAVVSMAAHVLWTVGRQAPGSSSLIWPARWLGLSVVAQVLLGLVALFYLLPFGGVPAPVRLYEAIVRTGHQTNAALLLGAGVVLALRSRRHLSPVSHEAGDRSAMVTNSAPKPTSLEVVT